MLRACTLLLSAALVLSASVSFAGEKKVPESLDFTMKSLNGKEVDLSKYQGKVLLVVNVASECGYTPQYAGLQQLHEKYADQGLAVLGFPCNQFGAQEPGTAAEIAQFCEKNYGVGFDMFAKVDVNGSEQCDFYKYLTSQAGVEGKINWNFEKFLIGRDGKIVGRYPSKVKPAALAGTIEKELAAK